MGEMTFWDRISPWLLHPFRTAALTFVFRYVENHPDLELRFSDHVQAFVDEDVHQCRSCGQRNDMHARGRD